MRKSPAKWATDATRNHHNSQRWQKDFRKSLSRFAEFTRGQPKKRTIDGRLNNNATWISINSKVDVGLARMKKSNTSKEKYQQEAFSILHEYEMVAYTGGSRL
jgi:hypothetical protein